MAAGFPHLKRVVIGGSACPRAITETFQDVYGVEVIHAWGMTEMSPARHRSARSSRNMQALTGEARLDIQQKQGHPPFGVEMRIEDDAGRADAVGRENLRPPQGARPGRRARLFQGDGGDILDRDGFFDTGDVATIDRHGYMQITDRSKDVIKSGGEWISSIDDRKSGRRPSQGRRGRRDRRAPSQMGRTPAAGGGAEKGRTAGKDDILGFLRGKVANWWLPDDVVFVDEIPHTATGKIQKMALRERFKDYELPTVRQRKASSGPLPRLARRSLIHGPAGRHRTGWSWDRGPRARERAGTAYSG